MLYFLKKYKTETILLILVLFIFLTNLTWINQNTQIPSYDPSWYLENSQLMYHQLTENGLMGFIQAYVNSFRIKAPLISVVPLLFFPIFGNVLKTAFVPNLIFIFVLNYFLFKLAYRLTKDKKIALLACIITSLFPMTITLAREIMVEYFTMTLTVMWLYFLLKSDYFTRRKENLILGVLLGLGLLYKVLFPFYIALPALYILFILIKEKRLTSIIKREIGLILLIGFIIAATWYFRNFIYIAYFLYTGSIGTVAKDYASPIIAFIKSFINSGPSFYLTILFIISGILLLIKKISEKQKVITFNFIFLLSWFLPSLLFLLSTNKSPRFLATFLPALGIILAIFIVNVFPKNLKLFIPLSFIILIFPVYSYLYSSFNLIPGNNLAFRGYILLSKNNIPQTEYWPIDQIIDFIYKDNIWNDNETLILLVPAISEFNHNNFRYLTAWKNYKNLEFGGLPRDTEQNYFNRLNEADYLIYFYQNKDEINWVNKFNDLFLEKIEKNELPYTEIKRFDLPEFKQAIILKK